MKKRDKKVIGYFAFHPRTGDAVCDGDACMIAGSEDALNSYISRLGKSKGKSKGRAYSCHFDRSPPWRDMLTMGYKLINPGLGQGEKSKTYVFSIE